MSGHHQIEILFPTVVPTQHLDRKGQPQIPMTPYTLIESNNIVLGFLVVDSNDMFIAVICWVYIILMLNNTCTNAHPGLET